MVKRKLNRKVIIVAAGSGGHLSAATAIIDGLREKYSDVDQNLLFVGGDLAMTGERGNTSLEEKKVKELGIQFKKVRAGKLQRRFSLSTIPLAMRTVLGIIDAYRITKEFSPDLIISTGGYVCVPVAIAAYMLKIPVFLHEQTAAIGLSNKIVSKIAQKVFITFPSSARYIPENKAIHVGNAVRKSVFQTKGEGEIFDAITNMKKREKELPILYISGGGQGSHIINLTIRDILPTLLQKYQIILQTGDNQVHRDYEVLYRDWKGLSPDLRERLFVTKFIDEKSIGSVFNNATLFVGRSGANTVYELGALGIPAILIPIPWVTHNEQELNAKILVDLGQAMILPEGELNPSKLKLEIDRFVAKLGNLEIDQAKAKEIFRLDAVERMLTFIFKEDH